MLDATPETAEVVEEVIQDPTEPQEAPETPEGEPEAPVETPEDAPEGEPEDAPEETPEDAPAEPVTFDATEELPIILEKTTEVLDRYEIPQEVQAVIDVYKAKAESAPQDILGEYEVFGTTEEVKSLLEEQSLLYAQKMDEDGSNVRPKTDEFAQKLHEKNADTAAYLRTDLLRLPSTKYPGRSAAQEFIADALARPGDTVNSVLERFDKFAQYMREGSLPLADVPTFIPEALHSTYNSLPKDERDEYDLFSDADPVDQERKLQMLARIKKGIDADAQENQLQAYKQHQERVGFNSDIQDTQDKFITGIRDAFTEDVLKTVKFSDDPKVQAMSTYQAVALVSQAFDDGSAGEYARKGLQEAGVPFDNSKAQTLLKAVEVASVALVSAKRAVGPDGKVLDPIALNKATKEFENTGRQWQTFKKDILDKLTRITATGKEEAVKSAVEKIKLAPKARNVAKSVGSPVQKGELNNPHPYGSVKYYEWWADQELKQKAAVA